MLSYNDIPEKPNRDYVRQFKKRNKLSKHSNEEVRQLLMQLKQDGKNELIRNLNDMIDPNDLEIAIDENETLTEDNTE